MGDKRKRAAERMPIERGVLGSGIETSLCTRARVSAANGRPLAVVVSVRGASAWDGIGRGPARRREGQLTFA
jgi:predicted esterase